MFLSNEATSHLMICSLSRQVMRNASTCGQALAAIGKSFAHVWCRIQPIDRCVIECSTFMHEQFPNIQSGT